MADVVFVEDIFADHRKRSIQTLFDRRIPTVKLALHTVEAKLGAAKVIIEFDPPGADGPEYIEVPLGALNAAVKKVNDQYIGLAPPGSV
jgi:hypothetical protein